MTHLPAFLGVWLLVYSLHHFLFPHAVLTSLPRSNRLLAHLL